MGDSRVQQNGTVKDRSASARRSINVSSYYCKHSLTIIIIPLTTYYNIHGVCLC